MFRTFATVVLLCLSVLAAALRLTVRDALPWLAPIYYAFPSPVIAATVLLAAVLMHGRVRPTVVRALLVGGLSIAVAGLSAEVKGTPCESGPASAQSLRVLTWNLSHGYGGWDAVAERAAAVDADLLVLIEAGGDSERFGQLWRKHFPGHDISMPGGGITLVTRGRLAEVRFHELRGRSRAVTAQLVFNGRNVDIIAVDLDSNPFFARGPTIAGLTPLTHGRDGVPMLIAGDFNTPLDSTWFVELKSRFKHAFSRAGYGLAATWPVPAPILAIDHVWVSPEVEVRCERHVWTSRSDHSQLVTDLVVASKSSRDADIR